MERTNIAIDDTTRAQLAELARWAGISVDEALAQAIKDQYDRKFWDAVNAGYANLRGDPAAWAEVEAERKLWDKTLMDGLDPGERWSEDRGSLPPPPREQAS